MSKIWSYEAGITLDSHMTFLQKLTDRGARKVNSAQESNAIIVFCPIVSRYETDILSALSSIPEPACDSAVILVAMHHTFDKDYIVPKHRELGGRAVALHVDCLFHESMGLLKCPFNEKAIKMVRKKLGLTRCFISKMGKSNKLRGKK